MERERASTVRSLDETPSWPSYGADHAAVEQCVRTRFNDKVFDSLEERTLRVMEEAIELFDSEHKDREAARAQAHKLVDEVFKRPKIDQNQEAGGVVVTFLAYCAAKGVRADTLANAEINRIHKMPKEHFKKRQLAKAEAGIALSSDLSAINIMRRRADVKMLQRAGLDLLGVVVIALAVQAAKNSLNSSS